MDGSPVRRLNTHYVPGDSLRTPERRQLWTTEDDVPPPRHLWGRGGTAKFPESTARPTLDDPTYMKQGTKVTVAAQAKPLAPPKLKPVTVSMFRSVAKAAAAGAAVESLVNGE